MKKILIAGGTGFIGKILAETLYKEGHLVSLLSRNPVKNYKFPTYKWDPQNGRIDLNALNEKDIVINLSGSSIAKWPWTKKRKLSVYNSRILSTRLLAESIIKNKFNPSQFISISATGYYGHRPGEKISELSAGGNDFFSKVCMDWENEAICLKDNGIGVSIIRTGIVLSDKGGILPILLIPFRFRISINFNKGLHRISWIHIEDLIRIFSKIVNRSLLPGIYNAVAPNPVNQLKFNESLCSKSGKRPLRINLPEKLLKLIAGDMTSLLITDQNIIPSHLQAQDFNFLYPEISDALKNLI